MNTRLEELLSEPIVRLLMRSDGVDVESVRALMHAVRRGLQRTGR